jgi:hypothetical protein
MSPWTGLTLHFLHGMEGGYFMDSNDSRSREYISWICAWETPMSQSNWLNIAYSVRGGEESGQCTGSDSTVHHPAQSS